jgi:hypothetical protein
LTRLALVLFVWLVIVPLNASQVWDMAFIKNPREFGGFQWFHSDGNAFYEIACGQLIFLCSMLVSAALLMCLELTDGNMIQLPVGGFNDWALFDGNESLVEIIGMRGSAVNLVKRAFKVH